MGRRRVPELHELFDQYIRNTTKVLESGTPTGAVRLGLSNTERDRWIAYRDEWIVLYPKYTNLNYRTTTVTQDKNKLMTDFTAFSAKPLDKIRLSDNLTNADRVVFRLPPPDKKRTPRGSMAGDIPFSGLDPMGGGMIKVRTRLEHSVGRPRKHPLCDVIEMKYLFIDAGKNFMNPLIKLEDCTHSTFSRTAMWRMEAGTHNLGKRLIGFLRYVNHGNPMLNSGWSPMVMVIVA